MMIFVPWVLAVLTAAWFALAARKAGRNPLSWGLSGALFGLVTATIVLGLGRATNNPFSDQQRHQLHFRWTAEAVVTIAVLGWVATLGLHRQHAALWAKLTGKPASQPPAPASIAPAGKTEPAKQPAKP